MLRRDFLKILGAIGAIATLPLNAIPERKVYPKIRYEREYIPQKLCYLHKVYGKENDTTWMVFEYGDSENLPDDVFLAMVKEISKKL
ncbi:MAG: hypothetical protein E3J43_08375 [Candidatus Heimdallarchaeota archaeon]|nr:MAG: hypothetical protein E3J43_08375 [Candidatus Heimdallarchaeota archaeon]